MDTPLKHTKIVSTLSPKVATPQMLTNFIQAGANVFRLNFSHGTYPEYIEMIQNIKQVREELQAPVAILQDLQGPRVRVTALSEPVDVVIGDVVALTYDKAEYSFPSDQLVLPLDHNLTPILSVGESILIEDGLIELVVKEVHNQSNFAYCEAKTNSQIRPRKGVNFSGSSSEFPVITDKDRKDLAFGLEQGVDIIAMSFVRSAEDIRELRALIEQDPNHAADPLIIAKIEKPDAVEQIESIMDTVDGVMVARGDLGIEVQAEKVPIIQKHIIELALSKGKQVIVATQMLDSMIRNPRPTRAEVSDVANAVIDHTDAVMLSGETSGGQFPLEAVDMMKRIIIATEASAYDDFIQDYGMINADTKEESLAYGAQHLAQASKVDGIIVVDPQGGTISHYLSRFRTEVPVFTLSSNKHYLYRTALVWGVYGKYLSSVEDVDMCIRQLVKSHYAPNDSGYYFVIIDISNPGKESIHMMMV